MSAEKPVPEGGLSTAGRARAETFARAELLLKTALIISSAERKAIETAEKGQANGGRTQLIGRFRSGRNSGTSGAGVNAPLVSARCPPREASPALSSARTRGD